MYGIFCAESQTLFQVSSPDMGSEVLRLGEPSKLLERKKHDVVAMLHIGGILIGTKTTLLVKVLEVEVSKPEKQPRGRLLVRTPVVKAETNSDSRSMNSHTSVARLKN